MKKSFKILRRIIYILVEGAAAVFLGYTVAYFGMLKPLWLSLPLLAVGVFLSAFLHIIMHELGHYFGGKAAGYKLMSFRIGFFKIVRIGDTLSLKIQKLKEFGGVCQMAPVENKDIIDDFYKFVRGGLIGSVVATLLFGAFSVLPYVISVSPTLYLLFSSGLIVSLALDFLNFRPVYTDEARTDAGYLRVLKEGGDDAEIVARTTLFQTQLMAGLTPSEIDEEILKGFPKTKTGDWDSLLRATYFYAYYLDKGDVQKLIEETAEIERESASANEIFAENVLADVLYTECAIKKDKEKAKELYKVVAKVLDRGEEPSAYRIKAAYLLYALNDKQNAIKTANEGLKLVDTFVIKGLGKMEIKLLNQIIEEAKQ